MSRPAPPITDANTSLKALLDRVFMSRKTDLGFIATDQFFEHDEAAYLSVYLLNPQADRIITITWYGFVEIEGILLEHKLGNQERAMTNSSAYEEFKLIFTTNTWFMLYEVDLFLNDHFQQTLRFHRNPKPLI